MGETQGSINCSYFLVNLIPNRYTIYLHSLYYYTYNLFYIQYCLLTKFDCNVFNCFFRQTEKVSVYFLLQHRVGHGQGNKLSSLLVGTFDSIFDTKPCPYRILHQTRSSEVYYGTTLF